MPASASHGAPLMANRQGKGQGQGRDHRKDPDREHADEDDAALLQREDYYADDAGFEDETEFGDDTAELDPVSLPKPNLPASSRVSVWVWLLTMAACISGLLFGCTSACPF